MSEPGNTRELVSESELVKLTDLFLTFEGGDDPASLEVQKAKMEFDRMVTEIYWDRVHPEHGERLTSMVFRSHGRNRCRKRLGNLPPCA